MTTLQAVLNVLKEWTFNMLRGALALFAIVAALVSFGHIFIIVASYLMSGTPEWLHTDPNWSISGPMSAKAEYILLASEILYLATLFSVALYCAAQKKLNVHHGRSTE